MKKVMIKEKYSETRYYFADTVEVNGGKLLLKDSVGELVGWFQSDQVENFGIVAE